MAATANGQWSYAVPLDETETTTRPQARRQNTGGSSERDYRNLKSATRRTGELGIQSDSEETRQRRKSLKAGNAGAARKRSRNTLRNKASRDYSAEAGPVDDSAWIHRDKLAQIEIQEMVEAGIPVRMSRRSMSLEPGASTRSSRSLSRPRRSTGGEMSPENLEEQYNTEDAGYEIRRKRISTINQAEEEEQASNDGLTKNAAAPLPSSPTQTQRPGTSHSRIPISTGTYTGSPRSRQGSIGVSGNWDELARRHRSNSTASQVLLDDDDTQGAQPVASSNGSSNERSPPKVRTTSKAAPSFGTGRKGSNTNARPGSSAGKKPGQRSTSRSDTRNRPSISSQYPPEGDPPWISNMYKPDPRLPPDQQMLPTHARRLAQEQWEKEGKTGTVYDRDLRLLNNEEFPPAPVVPSTLSAKKATSPVQIAPPSLSLDIPGLGEPSISQPLPSPSRDLNREPHSPSRSVNGGYRITPTIAATPQIQRPPTAYSQHHGMINEPQASARTQLDEKAEDAEEKKGGCACCVVM